MSDSETFHIGDVLTVTTGRLLSPTHMEGVYRILNYLTGDSLYTHQLPRAAKEVLPWVERQIPALSAAAMEGAVADLDVRLASAGDPSQVVAAWVAEQAALHGETHALHPIPREEHEVIDPLEELKGMVDPAKIVVVRVGDD